MSTTHHLPRVALAVLAVAGVGLAGLEISQALGDDAVDDHVVRAPVHRIVVEASAGDVRLLPRAQDVRVHVRRNHLVNTPNTSETVSRGVLTLRTSCSLGLLSCRADYRLGVPPGVDVEVRKESGTVDARALGGTEVAVGDATRPVHARIGAGTLRVVRR